MSFAVAFKFFQITSLFLVSFIYHRDCIVTKFTLFSVPIIPDYLFFNDINISISAQTDRLGPASLSPLQRKYETLEKDNGPMGALLASKAFVQLAVTPFVGYIAAAFGCTVPLFFGSCNMLLASVCE